MLQAILVLGGSFLSEGGSCLVALNETRKKAKERGMGYIEYSTYSYGEISLAVSGTGIGSFPVPDTASMVKPLQPRVKSGRKWMVVFPRGWCSD